MVRFREQAPVSSRSRTSLLVPVAQVRLDSTKTAVSRQMTDTVHPSKNPYRPCLQVVARAMTISYDVEKNGDRSAGLDCLPNHGASVPLQDDSSLRGSLGNTRYLTSQPP